MGCNNIVIILRIRKQSFYHVEIEFVFFVHDVSLLKWYVLAFWLVKWKACGFVVCNRLVAVKEEFPMTLVAL